jgi:hypothetical protein
MATIYDNHEAQQNSNMTGEPLTDVTGGHQAEDPDGSGSAYKSRRRCLSDLQGGSSELGDDYGTEAPDAGSQSQAASDGLIDLTTPPGEASSAEPPRQPNMRAVAETSAQASDSQPINEAPVVEQPEYRPKASRPRLTQSQPQMDVPPATPTPEAPAKGLRPRLGRDKPQPTMSGGCTPPLSDMARLEQSVSQLRRKQNLTLALVGVLAAAVTGVLAWIVFTTLVASPIS